MEKPKCYNNTVEKPKCYKNTVEEPKCYKNTVEEGVGHVRRWHAAASVPTTRVPGRSKVRRRSKTSGKMGEHLELLGWPPAAVVVVEAKGNAAHAFAVGTLGIRP